MRSRVVFGHVGLCMYVCMYMWTKTPAVCGFTTRKSPVSVIYCSLVKFNDLKRGLICQAIRSGKEIWNHSITGKEKGSWKIVLWYATPCLHAMQLCNAKECRTPTYNCSCADLQYRYRCSLYWQCLERTGYMFCETLVTLMYSVFINITYANNSESIVMLQWCMPNFYIRVHVHV